MSFCEVVLYYGIDPSRPKKISTPIIEDILPIVGGPTDDYNFATATAGFFTNTFQLASALVQTLQTDVWGLGVQPFGAECLFYPDDDPDNVVRQLQTFVELTGLSPQAVGGGPKNRVLGLKTQAQKSGAAVIMASGYCAKNTAAYEDGESLAGFALLDKLRDYLNGSEALWAVSGSAAVERTLVLVNFFPNKTYHGVRRA